MSPRAQYRCINELALSLNLTSRMGLRFLRPDYVQGFGRMRLRLVSRARRSALGVQATGGRRRRRCCCCLICCGGVSRRATFFPCSGVQVSLTNWHTRLLDYGEKLRGLSGTRHHSESHGVSVCVCGQPRRSTATNKLKRMNSDILTSGRRRQRSAFYCCWMRPYTMVKPRHFYSPLFLLLQPASSYNPPLNT